MVTWPKVKRTYCWKCKEHSTCAISQYSAGKRCPAAQGERRYHRKQKGYGGQTKPVFKKKAKLTRKVTLKLTCKKCKLVMLQAIKRCKTFELIDPKKNTKKKNAVVF
ncbi:MAG: hypothetical protein MHM6MM_001652 [Cercozoa sp. M6MM]